MGEYYDGTKLLSMKDINGDKPEIFMCTSNRTAGKTTYFNRLVTKKFLNENSKFMVLYRFNYELDEVAETFFKDIKTLFFPRNEMTSKKRAKGIFYELFIDEKPCGYAVALNNADQIKKRSHLFSDVDRMVLDEFQSETNHYCTDEVEKLISIHTSVARGQGEQVRYVPLYMMSNPVTILNPYYVSMGISSRLKEDTKFLKGDGFVLEQGFNFGASEAQKESGFNKAFSKSKYVAYASEAIYLNDSKAFIEKGFIYCDNHADRTFPFRITTTTEDHNVNYVMLKRNDFFLSNMRFLFEKGCFRFKDMMCKEAVLSALKY